MAKYTHKKRAAVAQTKLGPTITPAQEDELKWLRDAFQSLGRRTTAQAFEIGGYLVRAKSILPEKALGAWIKTVCKFTPKTGRNYMAVHANLAEYKERLEAAAVAPTVLFVLAHAEQPDVERVISAIETGEQLTVAQVKAMVGVEAKRKSATTDDALNVGGLAGLRKAAELKTTQDVTQFHGLMSAVLKRVEKAMEPIAKGRAVKKGMLQEAIVYDCRHAHDLLNSIAAPMKAEMVAHVNWRPAHLPTGSAWRTVQALLHRMGGVDGWPDRTEFVGWLQDEVIPALRFVVHGEALTSTEEKPEIADASDQLASQEPVEANDRVQRGEEATLAQINSVFNGFIAPAPAGNSQKRRSVPSAVAA
ncbi:hypothetical protein PZN02_001568 [Sinorhizobium garamanticum]|uniref:DUF3102 domain-containing protein n=1 Tax=Sinorhizobium garamanticum TaxID=680247 RepID=A0ABY8DH77_9HYPH|nr:hypothetical protein [Sinorhizobium garamanticum]WEX89027.1 hypothetical protein PZN02_001568 [Sinorhizobium garamanticum]